MASSSSAPSAPRQGRGSLRWRTWGRHRRGPLNHHLGRHPFRSSRHAYRRRWPLLHSTRPNAPPRCSLRSRLLCWKPPPCCLWAKFADLSSTTRWPNASRRFSRNRLCARSQSCSAPSRQPCDCYRPPLQQRRYPAAWSRQQRATSWRPPPWALLAEGARRRAHPAIEHQRCDEPSRWREQTHVLLLGRILGVDERRPVGLQRDRSRLGRLHGLLERLSDGGNKAHAILSPCSMQASRA